MSRLIVWYQVKDELGPADDFATPISAAQIELDTNLKANGNRAKRFSHPLVSPKCQRGFQTDAFYSPLLQNRFGFPFSSGPVLTDLICTHGNFLLT